VDVVKVGLNVEELVKVGPDVVRVGRELDVVKVGVKVEFVKVALEGVGVVKVELGAGVDEAAEVKVKLEGTVLVRVGWDGEGLVKVGAEAAAVVKVGWKELGVVKAGLGGVALAWFELCGGGVVKVGAGDVAVVKAGLEEVGVEKARLGEVVLAGVGLGGVRLEAAVVKVRLEEVGVVSAALVAKEGVTVGGVEWVKVGFEGVIGLVKVRLDGYGKESELFLLICELSKNKL
jgi:hypothetical protein